MININCEYIVRFKGSFEREDDMVSLKDLQTMARNNKDTLYRIIRDETDDYLSIEIDEVKAEVVETN